MHYSEIRNHIITKNYYWYYCIIIVISLVLALFSFYGSVLALLIFWLSIMSIGCILMNYYRCRRFFKFYNNFLKDYNVLFDRALIEKESYRMSVPYKSYDATIQSSPKSTNVVYLETDVFLLLFFSIRYLGIFQLVLKPFIFLKPQKEFHTIDKSVTIIRDFKIIETEEDRTIIFPNKDGIKRIILLIEKTNQSKNT